MSFDYDNTFEEGEFACDECSEETTYEGEFMNCISQAKIDGWIIRFINGEWWHFCSQECWNKYKGKKEK